MKPIPLYLVAAGLIRREDAILLVHETDPESGRSYWALPGGVSEPGETLAETLVREVREETGLCVDGIGRLLHLTQTTSPRGGSLAAIFEVNAWSGDLAHADPDGRVHHAAFLPVPAACNRLQELPWPPMWQPIVAFLRGESPAGSVWTYRQDEDAPPILIARLP